MADGHTLCEMRGRIDFSAPLTINQSNPARSVAVSLDFDCPTPDPLRALETPVNRVFEVELDGTTEQWDPQTCLTWDVHEGTAADMDGTGAGNTVSGEWYMSVDEITHDLYVRVWQTNDRDYEFDSTFSFVTAPTTQNCIQGVTTFQIVGVAQLFVTDGPSWDLAPPVLVTPASGQTAGREGAVAFTVRADNLRGAASYHAEITVRNGSGAVVGSGLTNEAPQGVNATGTTLLPLSPGTYTWTARSITPGYSSGESTARTLTIPANGVPSTPQLVTPSVDQALAEAGPQVFTVRSTDPEGDPYTGVVTVRDRTTNAVVRTFDTASSASGNDAVGHPVPSLPAGLYSWRAHSEDALGASSSESASRDFSVQATPTNAAPGAPTLVAPSSGTYSFGEPASFTVRVDDPNLDPYMAHITVRHSDGTEYDIDTLYTASGTDASGSPGTFLPSGSYTWWATAEDVHGATGPQSSTGSFTVSSSFLSAV